MSRKAWARRRVDPEPEPEQPKALQRPAGHDHLCGCEECVAYYAHLAEQRAIETHLKRLHERPRPTRANSKYNPHTIWRDGPGPFGWRR